MIRTYNNSSINTFYQKHNSIKMNKKLTSLLFASILWSMPLALHAQYHSKVWNPDNGNGTYTNPVIYADYSDPDVVAVGDDYYLKIGRAHV